MVSLWRTSLALGLTLAALLAALPNPARAQPEKKTDSKRVDINTFDGVNLAGTLYPATGGGRKDAVVLLLHDFDHKGGGNSSKDGWPKLAARLQAEGYAVLSFDFRGFGESTTVSEKFWDRRFAHNQPPMIRQRPGAGGKLPTTISQKDFRADYYKYLVNDIAAAKAYLDERNDASELNSGNVILVGAGQGATLGAMWLASECRRCKGEPRAALIPGLPVNPAMFSLDDPESKYIAGAVWLTISPTLAGASVGPLVLSWTKIAGAEKQIPMGFVYGKNDSAGDQFSRRCLANIKAGVKGKLEFTGDKPVEDSAATSSRLLDIPKLDQWIVTKYINPLVEGRRSQGRKDRKVKESYYVYALPRGAQKMAKYAGEEVPYVDVAIFYGR